MEIAKEMGYPVVHMKLNNGWIMSMIEMLQKKRKVMFRPYFMKVYGLRSKVRTLTSKKEQNKLKKWRKASLMNAKTTRRLAEWLFSSPKVPVCQPQGKKPSRRQERGSRRIAD
uniref:Uncharacterized protein n=1 Tax=Solanum tuberosum TaxID=4113 RepID=M1DK82_SOLTU